MSKVWKKFELVLQNKEVSVDSILGITDESLITEMIKTCGFADPLEISVLVTNIKKRRGGFNPYQNYPKKQKLEANEDPFLYGTQNFLDFGSGAFFRDNTKYIAMIEDLNQHALISLFPRRFGKSLFVSLLNEYYDIKNKNRLKELFAGTWIADHLTPNVASFLVLPLDFSNLNTTNYGSFQRDFNAKNNTLLNTFLNKYQQELAVMEYLPTASDFVQNLREVLSKVLFVTIDEYDSSLMSNQLSRSGLSISKTEPEKMEHAFKRFFSALNEGTKQGLYVFATGVYPLCLEELTNGWITLSNLSQFAEMYGFLQEDVARGIKMIDPPLPDDVQVSLLEHCHRYDGYQFNPAQKKRVFNPGRIMYFLKSVRLNWHKSTTETGAALVKFLTDFKEDPQTKPAQSTLKYLQSNEASRWLFQQLLQEPDAKIICSEDVNPAFDLANVEVDRQSLISFMFYAGALTYTGEGAFKIPNDDAKMDFNEAAMRVLGVEHGIQN